MDEPLEKEKKSLISDRRSGELTTALPQPHSASGSVWEPQRSVCAECVA